MIIARITYVIAVDFCRLKLVDEFIYVFYGNGFIV